MKKQNKLLSFLFEINIYLFLLVSTSILPGDFVCPRELYFHKKLKDNVLLFDAKNSSNPTQKYVVKAYFAYDMSTADLFASELALKTGIPSAVIKQLPRDTYLITNNKSFTPDAFINRWNESHRHKFEPILTIHPYIEGKTLEKDKDICIQGLNTSRNLRSIAYHTDLAKITALGIYLSDEDCHSMNLICQEENTAVGQKTHYHCIDWDHSYGSALGYFAEGWGKNLEELTPVYYIENKKEFDEMPNFLRSLGYAYRSHQYLATLKPSSLSSQEKEGLMNVNTTLQKLKHNFPIEALPQMWLDSAEALGWKLNNEQKSILTAMIDANYDNVEKVSRELERLTQK